MNSLLLNTLVLVVGLTIINSYSNSAEALTPMGQKQIQIPSAENGDLRPYEVVSGAQIVALGMSYKGHIEETGSEPSAEPIVFKKSYLPAGSEVKVPSFSEIKASVARLDPDIAEKMPQGADFVPLFDYEVELGIYVLDTIETGDDYRGKVAFFLAGDLTLRSLQVLGEGEGNQLEYWAAGKSFPGFFVHGKNIWVPHQPIDFVNVDLTNRINGELRQKASTSEIIYSTSEMISAALTLAKNNKFKKGDVILTGTPSGIAFNVPKWKKKLAKLIPSRSLRLKIVMKSNKDNPKFLKSGDTMEMSAGYLGTTSTKIK